MAQSNKTIFERKSLREWIQLEEARSKIRDMFKTKDAVKISDALFEYLQLASSLGMVKEWDKLDSITLFGLYLEAYSLNSPKKEFPILKAHIENKDKHPDWEYPGRQWYFWLNLFSKNYSWSIEYISKLDIDDAIGLYQEVEIDKQLEKEWEWSRSEIAFVYDKNSKSSHFQPLPRPQWMLPIAPKPRIVRIRKDMLPIGNIEGNDGIGQVVDPSRDT